MKDASVDTWARKIWEYHQLHHKLEKADCILVLTSHDIRVADYAAQLFLQGFAPMMIFSGGIAHQGDLLETPWKKPEADVFAERAIKLGVPKEKILIENKSTNTGESVQRTGNLLKERGLHFQSFIVVQKPYGERRAYATVKLHWPAKRMSVTSPPISFDSYPNEQISKETLINIMVGDLQRIKQYPEKGFQIAQEIPDEVWEAFQNLVKAGFTKHLLKGI